MNRFPVLQLITFLAISTPVVGQDSLFLRNGVVWVGKIFKADSSKVIFRNSLRPDGPDYIYNRSEVKKVISADRTTINYPNSYYESSIGLCAFYESGENMYLNYDALSLKRLNTKGGGIKFTWRNSVIGLALILGVINTSYVLRSSTYSHYSYGYYPISPANYFQYKTEEDKQFACRSTLRINSTKKKFNPYFPITFGFSGYWTTFSIGLGLQFKINNHYNLEAQYSLGRTKNSSLNEDSGVNVDYFEFGINRTIKRLYRDK